MMIAPPRTPTVANAILCHRRHRSGGATQRARTYSAAVLAVPMMASLGSSQTHLYAPLRWVPIVLGLVRGRASR